MSLDDIIETNTKSGSSSRGRGSSPDRRPQNHRGNNRTTPYSTNTKELLSEVGDMKRQQQQENGSAQEQKRKKRQLYAARAKEKRRVREEEQKKEYEAWKREIDMKTNLRCSYLAEKIRETWIQLLICDQLIRNQLKKQLGVANPVKLEEVQA